MLQYLLIIVVALVWGRVVLKLFKNFKSKTVTETPQIEFTDEDENFGTNDTFHLAQDYPDPFLAREIHAVKTSSMPAENKVKTIPLPKVEKPVLPWPAVSYKGIIKSLHSGKELIWLTINDRAYKMSPGEKQGDILLEKVYRDSIYISYNKQRKTVKK